MVLRVKSATLHHPVHLCGNIPTWARFSHKLIHTILAQDLLMLAGGGEEHCGIIRAPVTASRALEIALDVTRTIFMSSHKKYTISLLLGCVHPSPIVLALICMLDVLQGPHAKCLVPPVGVWEAEPREGGP